MGKRRISRSHYIALRECPRSRYWGYEYKGRGIQRRSLSIPLSTGSAVHEALHLSFTGVPLDEAVSVAQTSYMVEVEKRGYSLQSDDQVVQEVLADQMALIAGLVHGWYRARFPSFSAEYAIAERDGKPWVELEDLHPLTDNIDLMIRVDMVVRRLSDNALFAWSWKTTSSRAGWTQEKWDHDLQRLTETLPIPDCRGVIVEGLYKGRRDGHRTQSLLINAYYDMKMGLYHPEYKTGRRRVLVEDVKRWIDFLPIEKLREQFLQTVPLLVDQERLNSALVQMETEERCLEDLQLLQLHGSTLPEHLDQFYPQNFRHCHRYGGPCPFVPICFDGTDPEDLTIYEERKAHHEVEFAAEED